MFDVDKEISKSHLKSAGWKVDLCNKSNPFESHMFYIHDYAHGMVRLITVLNEDFHQISLSGIPKELSPNSLSTVIASLMKKVSSNSLTTEEELILVPALVGYIKSTQTYRQWVSECKANERLHALLNIYPADNGEYVVRPFIAKCGNTVMTVEEVINATNHVFQFDFSSHPDWFESKKINIHV